MISEEKLFGNFLEDEAITSTRLSEFAKDTYNRVKAGDTTGQFGPLLNSLGNAAGTLAKGLGEVSGGIATQKGKTATVDTVLADFKSTMSDLEGVIAYTLGGHSQPAYTELYPNGIEEYHRATKTTVPTLLQRVADMATKHAATLGSALATQLQSFRAAWDAARDAQQQQKGSVSDTRAGRSAARTNVELVLLSLIHTVAAAFPGDVKRCSVFFAFELLDTHPHKNPPKPGGNANP